MGPPKLAKVKKGQPPPIDKLIKPAIGIGLALLAYQFFKGLGKEVRQLSTLIFRSIASVLLLVSCNQRGPFQRMILTPWLALLTDSSRERSR